MTPLSPQEKTWINQLESNNPATIMIAIKEIRHHGNIRMLPYLFLLVQPATNPVIRESILLLVTEIKTQDAVPVIVDNLERLEGVPDFTRFVAACWQSALDFSDHLPAFIRIFAKGDYQTAVEAFSVIEESLLNANERMQKKCLQLLENSADQISEEKYLLYRELLKVVSGSF